ncbi:MAG TPA: tetratricopeptide repeat protein, partial [Spirochaetia bacterium]|nr:tetratricopeptide repeat protein [Spirochaetia bacterium]
LYEQRGEFENATGVFTQGLQEDANSPNLHYNLGIALQSEGKFEDAREQYQRALKSHPGWKDGLNNLGIVLEKLERYDESVKTFQEILRIDSDNATAHNNIATVLAKQGRSDEAIAYFKRALSNKPDYVRAAVNLGQILETYRNQNESLEEVRRLVSSAPDSVDLRFQLVHILINLQRYVEAEKHLRHILSKEPQNARAWQDLGGVYTRLGKNNEAAECYKHLQKLEPDNLDFRLELARIFRDLKHYPAGLTEVKKYLESRPDDLRGGLLYGDLLCLSGNPTEGAAVLEKLKELYPDNGNILAALAEAYRLLGDRDRAIGAADELINLQGIRANPEDIESLNESLGLYEKAVEAFERDHQDEWQRSLERLGRLTVEGSPEEERESATRLLEIEPMGFQQEDEDSLLDFEGDEAEGDQEEQLEESDAAFSLDDLVADAGVGPEGEVEPEYSWPAGKKPDLSLFGDDENDKVELPFEREEADSGPATPADQYGFGNPPLQNPPGQQPFQNSPGPQTAPPTAWPQQPAPAWGPPPGGYPPQQQYPTTNEAPGWPAPSGGGPPSGGNPPSGAGPQGGLLSRGNAMRGGPDPSFGPAPSPGVGNAPRFGEIDGGDVPADEAPRWPAPPPPRWVQPRQSDPHPDDRLPELEPVSDLEEAPFDLADELDVEGIPLTEVSEFDTDAVPEAVEEFQDAEELEPIEDSSDDRPPESSIFEGEAASPSGARETDTEAVEGIEDFLEESPGDDRAVVQDIRFDAPFGAASPAEHISTDRTPVGSESDAEDTSAHPAAGPRSELESESDMLDYLVDLTHQLPPDRARNFEHSEFRLRIESLKSRLAGRAGLLHRMQKYRDEAGLVNGTAKSTAPITAARIADTFSFLRRLAGNLPDASVATILQDRAQGLLQRLQAIRDSQS